VSVLRYRPARPLGLLSLIAVMAAGCGDDGTPGMDAGEDATADAVSPDSGGPTTPRPPAPPLFTPCPAGWREIPGAEPGEPTVCDPWPEGGPPDCSEGEAPRPGQASCVHVGDACPPGGFPVDLPSDAVVTYVREGATGGDGTLASPFGILTEALAAAPDGGVVALAPGSYAERIVIDRPVALWGGCTGVNVGTGAVRVSVYANDVSLRNVTIEGGTVGLVVRDVSVVLRGVIISDQSDQGLVVSGGSVDAEDLLLARIHPTPFLATNGARVTWRHTSVVGPMGTPIAVFASEFDAADLALVSGPANLGADTAMVFGAHATAHVARAAFHGLEGQGVWVDSSSLDLVDAVFDGRPAEAVGHGPGIAGVSGMVSLERVRLERPRGIGITSTGVGATLTARDVLVRDGLADVETAVGQGIEVADGASAVLERLRVDRVRVVALLGDGRATSVQIADLVITGTAASTEGTFGRAIQTQQGAVLMGTSVAVRDNHEAAVVGAGLGTMVDLTDVAVTATAERECAPVGCPAAGIGIGSYLGASVRVERFTVSESGLAGVQLARSGEIDLVDGLVENNPIGINVQAPGYSLERLNDRVYFRDNGANLVSTDLPVPDPTSPVAP